MDMNDLQAFVISSSEKEGHFALFDERQSLWQKIQKGYLVNLLIELRGVHSDLESKHKNKKADADIYITMDWRRRLSDTSKKEEYTILADQCGDVSRYHLATILHIVGKYTLIWLKKSLQQAKSPEKQPVISVQSDAGLLVLGSGCVGQMFKLYKSKRDKYINLLLPLSKMIIANSDKAHTAIPVEQKSRDKGGLYCLSSPFLVGLQMLDRAIRIELGKCKQHKGKELTQRVWRHVRLLPHLEESLKLPIPEAIRDDVATATVIKTFIRKYVHARIGGFVSGCVSKQAKAKGVREKGGGTLREKLTHVVKAKSDTKKKRTNRKLKLC